MFDFSELKEKAKNLEEWLSKELSLIRTGRANPSILDSLRVDAYGQKMSIKELGNIVLEDAKTIRIEPWDQNISKDIERAIATSDLGVSSTPFEKGLRIIFPSLTSERREQFIKLTKNKSEEAKTSLRILRDRVSKQIDEKEKSGNLSQDDRFKLKGDMQKIVDEFNEKFEDLTAKKEADIKT